MPSDEQLERFFKRKKEKKKDLQSFLSLKSHCRSKTAACSCVLQRTTRGWYWVCIQQRQFISPCTALKLREGARTLFLNVPFSACSWYVSFFQCLISSHLCHTSLSVCEMMVIRCHRFGLIYTLDSLTHERRISAQKYRSPLRTHNSCHWDYNAASNKWT